MQRLYLLVFFLFCFVYALPQTLSDSLFSKINRTKESTARLRAITDLTEHYINIHRDSLDKYAYEAKALAENQSDPVLKAKSALLLAQDYFRWGWSDSCIHTAEAALEYCNPEKSEMRTVYFDLKRLKALVYGGQNNYTAALGVLYKLVEESDTYQEYFVSGINSNTIGSIALAREDYGEALKWIRRGLRYTTHTPRPLLPASCYTNLAMLYNRTQNNDSALFYIQKAIPLSKTSGNVHVISTALGVYSTIALETGKITIAEEALQEMIEYRSATGAQEQYVNDKLMMADFYIQTNQVRKAIELCENAVKTGSIYEFSGETYTNNITNRLHYYEKLAECYEILGDKSAHTDMLKNIITAKDSLYHWNTENALAEMQTVYEVQQKEKTILAQRINLVRRGFIAFASAAALLVAIVIFLLLIRRNRNLNKARVAEAEENERKRIAAELHDNLGVQANAILYTSETLKANPEKSEELSHNLNDTAKEMLFILRETLWALKSAQTDTRHLWMRILNFLSQMSRTYPHIQFLNRGTVPENKTLSSSRGLNILMIIQESVNNAVKHSKTEMIVVESSYDSGQWKLSIKDNGIGFDSELVDSSHCYGLENMRQRAQESDLELEINSREGEGTEISLKLEIKNV